MTAPICPSRHREPYELDVFSQISPIMVIGLAAKNAILIVESGANSRRILGTTVVGGMIAATAIAIFIIPVTFYVSERFRRKPERATVPAGIPAPVGGASGDGDPAAGRR
jgi:hypothetical protein